MAILATDNFNRADNATLGANWSTQTSEATWGIATNHANAPGATEEGNYYSAITWPDDQYSKATLSTSLATAGEVSVRARCSGSAQTYYAGGHNFTDGASDRERLWKRVGGTYTQLAVGGTDYTPGLVYEIRAQGTTIKLFRSGSEILSATDGAIASGSAGIGGNASPANSGNIEDWEGGNFGAVQTSYVVRHPIY